MPFLASRENYLDGKNQVVGNSPVWQTSADELIKRRDWVRTVGFTIFVVLNMVLLWFLVPQYVSNTLFLPQTGAIESIKLEDKVLDAIVPSGVFNPFSQSPSKLLPSI